MFVSEVAPVAGGAYLIVGLGLICTYLVLFGLKQGYQYTLGALIRKLAGAVGGIRFIGGKLEDIFLRLDHYILGRIGDGLDASEAGLTKWWHGMEWLARETYDTFASFGRDVHYTIRTIVDGTIPAAVGAGTHGLRGSIGAVRRALQREAAQLSHALAVRAHAIEVELARDFGRAWRGIDHLRGVTIPHVWKGVFGAAAGVTTLDDYVRGKLTRRVTNLEKRLAAGTLGAVAIAALTRVYPWWKCTNVRRFNRNLCRSPIGSLDWLFALTAGALVALDVERIAHEGQDVANALAEIWNAMARQGS